MPGPDATANSFLMPESSASPGDSPAAASRAASDRGALLHLEGDLEGAKRAYEEALAADPDNAAALNNLGFLLAQQGRLEEAEELYNRAVELNPASSTARANLGNLLALKGDLGGAVRRLREAVEIEPRNLLAWDSLGRVLLKAGRPAEAEEAWRGAIGALDEVARSEAPSGDPSANRPAASDISLLYTGLGTAVAAQGRSDEAVRILQEAVAVDPECAEAWTQLGVSLFMRKDFGSAEKALKKALAINPDAAAARRRLGTVYLAAGDPKAARAELERACRADPADVGAQVDLAVLDLAEGRPDLALGRLEGIECEGEDGERVQFYRGVALDLVGRTGEALERLQPLAEQVFGKYASRARQYLASRRH